MKTLLRPRYWPGHLAMVVCVAIAVGLGAWQYDAWKTRRADAARDISGEKPVALQDVIGGDDPFPGRDLGRPVTFEGSWTGANVYVSDRRFEGRTGYWVVTALEVSGSGSAMPVVRGWSPTTDVPDPAGTAAVTGWLQATEGSGPFDEDPTDDVIPTMRIASLVEKVEDDLYSAYVVAREIPGQVGLDPVSPDAVPPVSSFTALRNLLYAVEWWIFGAFAFFVWWRWCRDELNPPDPETESDPETEPAPDRETAG